MTVKAKVIAMKVIGGLIKGQSFSIITNPFAIFYQQQG